MHSMINPNGEEFTQNNPTAGPTDGGQQQPLGGTTTPMSGTTPMGSTASAGGTTPIGSSRFQGATDKVSTMASSAWQQTRQTAGTTRERTEFLLRENPVPTG